MFTPVQITAAEWNDLNIKTGDPRRGDAKALMWVPVLVTMDNHEQQQK